MAIRLESREIDGVTYNVTQLPLPKARQALIRVTKLFAPALKSTAGFKDVESALAMGAGTLLETLSEEDLTYFTALFADVTTVSLGGREPALATILDAHFGGDALPSMFKWLAFCLELNFSSFFGGASGLKAALAKVTAGAMKAAGSPST